MTISRKPILEHVRGAGRAREQERRQHERRDGQARSPASRRFDRREIEIVGRPIDQALVDDARRRIVAERQRPVADQIHQPRTRRRQRVNPRERPVVEFDPRAGARDEQAVRDVAGDFVRLDRLEAAAHGDRCASPCSSARASSVSRFGRPTRITCSSRWPSSASESTRSCSSTSTVRFCASSTRTTANAWSGASESEKLPAACRPARRARRRSGDRAPGPRARSRRSRRARLQQLFHRQERIEHERGQRAAIELVDRRRGRASSCPCRSRPSARRSPRGGGSR